eukprot:scaffold90640_cov70-Phaeocystis_antarctica.AAC.2
MVYVYYVTPRSRISNGFSSPSFSSVSISNGSSNASTSCSSQSASTSASASASVSASNTSASTAASAANTSGGGASTAAATAASRASAAASAAAFSLRALSPVLTFSSPTALPGCSLVVVPAVSPPSVGGEYEAAIPGPAEASIGGARSWNHCVTAHRGRLAEATSSTSCSRWERKRSSVSASGGTSCVRPPGRCRRSWPPSPSRHPLLTYQMAVSTRL